MPRNKLYIGIDPGAHGGIAALCESGRIFCHKMPDIEEETLAILRAYGQSGYVCYAYIEQVQGYIGGRTGKSGEGDPGSAMFKFGMSYGGLRMALVAAGILFDKVPPATWQKEIGVEPQGRKTRTQHKNVLKAMAIQLFPDIKVTLATSDALLLAHFCRLKKQNCLK